MSKKYREVDAWPKNSYARFLWLAFGLWEDIHSLVDIYKEMDDPNNQLVLARHILIDFDSLDELFKEFHDHIKNVEIVKLKPKDKKIIIAAFSNYHKSVEPYRSLLKEIRNNLGSHRTGMPWKKAKKSGVTSPNEWGKWENLLVKLEGHCDLREWIDLINAAYRLLVIVKEFNLDAWYGWSDNGEIKLSVPILPPGFYPRDPEEY